MKSLLKKSFNVARFDTDSKVVGRRFKDYLEENKIPYTTIITWTGKDGLIGISFKIGKSRHSNLDLLAKFMEESTNEGISK